MGRYKDLTEVERKEVAQVTPTAGRPIQNVCLLSNKSKRMTAKQGGNKWSCRRRRQREKERKKPLIQEPVVKIPELNSSGEKKPLKHPLRVAH